MNGLNEYYFHHKVLEIDCLNFESTIEQCILPLKQRPFSLILIENIQEATYPLREKLFTAFRKGNLSIGNVTLNLNHAYILLNGYFPKTDERFIKNSSVQHSFKNQLYDLCDEVFEFKELNDETKRAIIKKRFKHLDKINEQELQFIVSGSKSIEEAEKKLMKTLTIAMK